LSTSASMSGVKKMMPQMTLMLAEFAEWNGDSS
jgi:hypothetical protein